MNHQFFILSILLFVLISCKSKSADLEKFERILGSEKSKVLTELTDDFENEFLAKKYPNTELSESYLNFMEEIANGNWPKKEEVISEKNDKKYKESGLMDEKYLFPDSVWIEEYGIATKWTRKNAKGKKESHESFRPVNSTDPAVLDSILELEKNIVDYNIDSDFTKALEAVKDQSPFINLYHTYITNAGMVGSKVLYSGIKDNNLDISGQLERQVIVLHFVY